MDPDAEVGLEERPPPLPRRSRTYMNQKNSLSNQVSGTLSQKSDSQLANSFHYTAHTACNACTVRGMKCDATNTSACTACTSSGIYCLSSRSGYDQGVLQTTTGAGFEPGGQYTMDAARRFYSLPQSVASRSLLNQVEGMDPAVLQEMQTTSLDLAQRQQQLQQQLESLRGSPKTSDIFRTKPSSLELNSAPSIQGVLPDPIAAQTEPAEPVVDTSKTGAKPRSHLRIMQRKRLLGGSPAPAEPNARIATGGTAVYERPSLSKGQARSAARNDMRLKDAGPITRYKSRRRGEKDGDRPPLGFMDYPNLSSIPSTRHLREDSNKATAWTESNKDKLARFSSDSNLEKRIEKYIECKNDESRRRKEQHDRLKEEKDERRKMVLDEISREAAARRRTSSNNIPAYFKLLQSYTNEAHMVRKRTADDRPPNPPLDSNKVEIAHRQRDRAAYRHRRDAAPQSQLDTVLRKKAAHLQHSTPRDSPAPSLLSRHNAEKHRDAAPRPIFAHASVLGFLHESTAKITTAERSETAHEPSKMCAADQSSAEQLAAEGYEELAESRDMAYDAWELFDSDPPLDAQATRVTDPIALFETSAESPLSSEGFPSPSENPQSGSDSRSESPGNISDASTADTANTDISSTGTDLVPVDLHDELLAPTDRGLERICGEETTTQSAESVVERNEVCPASCSPLNPYVEAMHIRAANEEAWGDLSASSVDVHIVPDIAIQGEEAAASVFADNEEILENSSASRDLSGPDCEPEKALSQSISIGNSAATPVTDQMISSKSSDFMSSSAKHGISSPKQHRHWSHQTRGLSMWLTSIRGFLVRLARPSVKDGHQRLEWTCNCGRNMYGDYTGSGLDSLAAKLRNINNKEHSSDADMFCNNIVSFDGSPKENESQSSSQGGSSQLSGSSDNASQATIPWTTSTQPSQLSSTSSQSLGLSQISTNTSLSLPSSEATPIQSFLELCVNRSKYLTSIGEIEIINAKGEYKIQSDFQLFADRNNETLTRALAAKIRKQYENLGRTGLLGYFYRPRDLRFVHFGIRKGINQAGIYNKSPDEIPPEHEVEEGRYHYYECPLPQMPPMDKRTFFHYFWDHASHAPTNDMTFHDRLPKKLGCSVLMASSSTPLTMGWGVHIIEGPNWPVFPWIVTALLAVTLVICAIYDAVVKGRESGFTIGQLIFSILMAVLSSVISYVVDTV